MSWIKIIPLDEAEGDVARAYAVAGAARGRVANIPAVLGARPKVLEAHLALKLTLAPRTMTADDIAPLRAEGLSDAGVHDVNAVVAYFNFVNRIAQGLGLELEEGGGSKRVDVVSRP